MDIIIDKPIEGKFQDKLNRNNFARNLAEKINNYNEVDSLTLGLMGEWGSGKSSIINMMLQNINQDKFCIIEFNPWYFSGRKQLISDFFQVLADEIKCSIPNEIHTNLVKSLNMYAKALKPFTLIPQLTQILGSIISGIKMTEEAVSAYNQSQNLNLSKIKKNINEELLKYDKKVLVIIDEIDRLENEEIKEIFQLVRALGDFNNIIYLLSFDKLKVVQALSGGEAYLDKIINVPIFIPEISTNSINRIFEEEIERIFKGQMEIDYEYWEAINKIVFKDNFQNIRELNRFLNIIRFNSDDIVKEVDIIDYLVITFLRLFDEEVFYFIKSKKEKLIYDRNYEDLRNEIKSVKSAKELNLYNLIKKVFLQRKYKKTGRCINDIKYFDSYFLYHLNGCALTIDEINSFTEINSKEQLEQIVEKYQDLEFLFDNLNELFQRLTDEKKCIFIQVFLSKVSNLAKQESNSFLPSSQKKAFDILCEVTTQIYQSGNFIEDIINNVKFDNSYELKSLLDYLVKINDRYSNPNLKATIKNKIEQLIEHDFSVDVVQKEFDKLDKLGINVKEYIDKITSTPEGIISYLKNLVLCVEEHPVEVRDEYGNPIDYYVDIEEAIVLESITKYIDYEYIKQKVSTLPNNVQTEYKDLLDLFNDSQPYDVVFARQKEYEEFLKTIDFS